MYAGLVKEPFLELHVYVPGAKRDRKSMFDTVDKMVS